MDELELKDEDVIRCNNCNSLLAEILQTNAKDGSPDPSDNRNSLKTRFKCIECYNCGASGFNTKIFEGRTFIKPPIDRIHLSTEDVYEDDDGVIICLFKTKKVKK